MPNANKININDVPANSVIMLKGELTFARLVSRVEGDELRRRNEENVRRGMAQQDRPYTTISLANVQIVPQSGDGNNLSIGERYIQGACYKSKAHPEYNWCYTIYDRSPLQLPPIAKRAENGDFEQIYPTQDLAAGQTVFLLIRIYKPKSGMNNGHAIDAVMVDSTEPVYFGNPSNRLASSLSLYNINFHPKSQPGSEVTPGTPEGDAQVAATASFAAPGVAPIDVAVNENPYIAPMDEDAGPGAADVPTAAGIRADQML